MKFIDLFSGCGGLSLGLLNAGHTGLFAIERSPDAFSTLKKNLIEQKFTKLKGQYNWPSSSIECTSHDILEQLERPEFLDFLDSLGQRQEVDLIVGGPPCQGFSSAGKRDPNDPRNKLAESYLEVVKRVQPKYILMENVRGITQLFSKAKANSIPVSQQLEQTLAEMGYVPFHFIEDSSKWGVPQTRHRFVLLAVRRDQFATSENIEANAKSLLELGKKIAPNVESHVIAFAQKFKKSKGLQGIVSCNDALSDLEVDSSSDESRTLVDVCKSDSPIGKFKQIPKYKRPESGFSNYQKLMKKGWVNKELPNFGLRLPNHTPEVIRRFNQVLSDIDNGEMQKRYNLARGKCLPVLYRKEVLHSKKHSFTVLNKHRPSVTVTTLPDDFLHYSEPRILTVRETARLQSFPDWFHFEGPYTTGGKLRKITCPKYTQVGNAVPPLMAEGLGLFIRDELPSLLSYYTIQNYHLSAESD